MYDTQYWYRPGDNSSVYNFNGYNGGTYWGAPSYPSDSRRNLGNQNVVNPVNPFSQYGQVQSNAIPENMVQPFSSYPPATPVGSMGSPVAGAGLNAFVESRRNAVPAGTAPQNNPWAQQAAPAQVPQINALNVQPNCASCSFLNGGSNNPWNYTVSSFDKKNVWNNEYTQPRPLDMPYDAWKNVNQQAQQGPNAYGQFNYATLGLNNFANHQPVSENWNDIATKNWSPETL